MQIIPAMDILGGECVRLTKGEYSSRKSYSSDPLEVALRFEGAGVERLHMVDLDGARESAPVNLRVLETIASRTSLKIDFGGGVKSSASLGEVFSAGARWAVCGSVAVTSPESVLEWMEKYPGRIIIGADVRDGRVATHGWLRESALSAGELLSRYPGATAAICTEISRDGMLSGIDTAFYTALQESFPATDIIASGGVSCPEDVLEAGRCGIRGIIIGKAFYEGRITLEDIGKLTGAE